MPDLDKQRMYNIKATRIRDLWLASIGIDKSHPDAKNLAQWKNQSLNQPNTADLADAIYFFLHRRGVPVLTLATGENGSDFTVADVNDMLDRLAESRRQEDDRRHLDPLIRGMSATEQRWLVRIILKNMHQQASGFILLEWMLPKQAADHRYVQTQSLANICRDMMSESALMAVSAKLNGPEHGGGDGAAAAAARGGHQPDFIQFGTHFHPTLADNVSREKLERVLAEEMMKDGGRGGIIAEPKFDGERLLIHMDVVNNKIIWYSRNGKDYSAKHSYMDDLLRRNLRPEANVRNIILDCEGLTWSQKRNGYLPFGSLRTNWARGGNHNNNDNSNSNFAPRPVGDDGDCWLCMCLFDVVFFNDSSIISQPLSQRKALLRSVLNEVPTKIVILNGTPVRSWREAMSALDRQLREGHEGIVLKPLSSPYTPALRGHWIKIKLDHLSGCVDTVDLVVLGSYFGTKFNNNATRAANQPTHFLVGVWAGGIDNNTQDTIARVNTAPLSRSDLAEKPKASYAGVRCNHIGFNPITATFFITNGASGDDASPVAEVPMTGSPLDDNARFVTVTKVGSGYSMGELQTMNMKLSSAVVSDLRPGALPPWLSGWKYDADDYPDVFYYPARSIIIEVLGYSFISTTKMQFQLTMRFPRFLCMRPDKSVVEATNLVQLVEIIRQSRGGFKEGIDPDRIVMTVNEARRGAREGGADDTNGGVGHRAGGRGGRRKLGDAAAAAASGNLAPGQQQLARVGNSVHFVDANLRRNKSTGIFAGLEICVLHFTDSALTLFRGAAPAAAAASAAVSVKKEIKVEVLLDDDTADGFRSINNNNNNSDKEAAVRARLAEIKSRANSRVEFTKMLSEHGASIAANPIDKRTDIVLSDNKKCQRVENWITAMQLNPAKDSGWCVFNPRTDTADIRANYESGTSKKCADIIDVKWAQRCMAEQMLLRPLPDEIIYRGAGMEELISELYDENMDAYFEPATTVGLRQSLARVGEAQQKEHREAQEARRLMRRQRNEGEENQNEALYKPSADYDVLQWIEDDSELALGVLQERYEAMMAEFE